MIRKFALAAALAVAGLAVPAHAQAVGDKDVITLNPELSYMIVQTSSASSMFSFPVTFIRRPGKPDIDDYLRRRAEALAKAHAKWEKRHAQWEGEQARWKKNPNAATRPGAEPVEPTDYNLAFPAIEQENVLVIGPFDRFSKANGRSTFLHAVRPGRYVFYGPVFTMGGAGTCMCMGSIEFEIKPRQIVYAGMMTLNFMAERVRAKAEKRPLPRTEMDLPETMTSIGWEAPEPGATVDPRLAAYTIVTADLRASGRVPNYFGVQIDRLTAVPGVLDYDRDKIVDLKAGK